MEWLVEVYRYDPAQDTAGRLVTYRVPAREKLTVLDALLYIQRHHDRSLAFRYACRLGMCGTCTVMVNGIPRWACRTSLARLKGPRLRITPLRHLPVIKDVLVDFTPFMDKYRAAMGYFVPAGEAAAPVRLAPQGRERQTIDPHLQCITCGACYAACTMLAQDPQYLGPAALNRAFTLVHDSRDGARAARLAAVGGEHGCWRCHTLANCTEVCPLQLRPSRAIQGLKRAIVSDWLRRALFPSQQREEDR
ncbi:MAG: fumarate reductase [Candidatus Tectimicrobiota bacterium]|nr:MAG: fumarate reductase [Candidatus Tectomicrobia bacterium]